MLTKTLPIADCRLRSTLGDELSVPKRGSVGSAIPDADLSGNNDPTLPRFGTDWVATESRINRQSKIGNGKTRSTVLRSDGSGSFGILLKCLVSL
jgi:hypothetical protein